MPEAQEKFVKTAVVAEYLDVPPTWLYNNAERLELPRSRIGNQYRYKLSEVAAWVERQGSGV